MTGHLVMIVFLLFRDPFHDRSLNSGEGKGFVWCLVNESSVAIQALVTGNTLTERRMAVIVELVEFPKL